MNEVKQQQKSHYDLKSVKCHYLLKMTHCVSRLVSNEPSEVVTTDGCVLRLPSQASRGLRKMLNSLFSLRRSVSKAELLWVQICDLQSVMLPEENVDLTMVVFFSY